MKMPIPQSQSAKAPLLPLGAMMMASLLGTPPVLAEEEKMLGTVQVTAPADASPGYLTTKTRIGKVVQDPQDIPQAITTVSRSLMDDQEVNSLRDALRNVSGLSFNAAEGGRSGDNMMLRGFYTFGDMYLDGIRDTAQYNRETFNTEQVDVLGGAAAMLFGRGQAGGVINQVSKTPQLYSLNKAEIALGSNSYREFNADLNQPLGATSAIRINLMNRDEGSSRANPVTGTQPEIHRSGVAPSIALGIGTDNEFTLSHLWMQTQDRADYGIPFLNGKPHQDFAKSGAYWGTDGTFDDSQSNISTLSYLHKFSPQTQWRSVARVANYQRAYWAGAPGNASNFASAGSTKTRDFETDNAVLQSDFNTAFSLFGLRNELVTGVEYLHESSKRWSLRNLGTTSNPRYVPGQYSSSQPSTYDGDTVSAYLQDTIEFIPGWSATAGIRRDDMRSDYTTVNGSSVAQFSGNFAENSYRFGLSWQPSPTEHYYVGWSDSFSPTADLYQLSGSQYPAERSQVVEIGSKWLLLDGALAFRTSLYHAVKDWERNTDLESTAAILTQKRKSDGLELELVGNITEEWEVFGGISLIDAKILEASPSAPDNSSIGQRPRNTPRLTGNLWTTYLLGNGFKAGLGFEYKSERTGFVPTRTYGDPNTIPSYVRWDAMLAWRQTGYTIKLNVQNLFDKLYYDALYDNGGFTVPGQSRRFILSGEFKF